VSSETQSADNGSIVIETPIRLEYSYTPGSIQSRFLRGIAEGRILGFRCSSCKKVYVPARGCCPMCGETFEGEVEVAQTGTVVTFAVTHVPSRNIKLELPYVSAEVLLDGSDTTTSFLMHGVKPEDVRMGMRVRTHWKPREEWETSMANIEYVEPIDEPDAAFDSYKEHV
jgi:uncharacterized protein